MVTVYSILTSCVGDEVGIEPMDSGTKALTSTLLTPSNEASTLFVHNNVLL